MTACNPQQKPAAPEILASVFYGCIGLGILMRVIAVFYSDFWLDELWSSDFSHPSRTLAEVIRLTVQDVHPPLYQILLHYWFQLFGFSETSGRTLSLLFGLGAMAGFYPLAATLYNKPVAHLATILFALNTFALAFSAEVRSYEMLLMLAIFSSYFFFARMLRQQKYSLAGYFLCSLLAVYTHYFGVILLVSHAIIWLIYVLRNKDSRLFYQLLAVYLLLLVAYLPMISYVIADASRPSFWIDNPGPLKLAAYILVYFGVPLAVPFLAFPLVALAKARPALGLREGLLFAGGLSVLLVPYVIGYLATPIINPRNAIIGLPYWILLIAFLTHHLGITTRKVFIAYAALMIIIATALMPWYKGERIDTLLEAVKASSEPLYMVNGGKLDTAPFIATKIELNHQRYNKVDMNIYDRQRPPAEKSFWVACYHTCDAIDLAALTPPHYRIDKALEAKGVKGLLLAKESGAATP